MAGKPPVRPGMRLDSQLGVREDRLIKRSGMPLAVHEALRWIRMPLPCLT